MRFRLQPFSGIAFLSCCVVSLLMIQQARMGAHAAAVRKGPPTSQENLPFPAPVEKNKTQYPPVLSPAEELKTFHMPPGYRVELVASDPLIKDPILAEFDGDGRLWVLEYIGWEINAKLENSLEPVNDIVILEDTNHDGVYDKRTVFMDHLILPRALKILDHNCALVGEPPHLWKACDTNGDLKADTKDSVSETFGTQGIVEHGANGLYWGMDNTIYVAEHTWDVQFKGNGQFATVPTENRGQWGITQDDAGRIYRNVNTDPLFTDYVAPSYYMRNPDVTRTRGLYESLVKQEDTSVWPIHPTLGVNRGYRPEVSRPDGSSYYYQGVSAPLIYRGDQLPKELYGQAFVVDGPTNLVHLLSLKDDGSGRLAASDFYKKGEFLASTDERFRPVSLTPGWDGSFYIVDMYRGVSQDGPLQTDYLRNYTEEHKLWEGIHYGRIYRVVHDGTRQDKRPAMLEETAAQLVPHLADANGWTRDTAQQLLVQRNDSSVVPALKKMAGSPDFRARLQAMWTLQGMKALDQPMVQKALNDRSPEVRAAALRWSENWLSQPDSSIKSAVLSKADDPNWQVRRQLAATLGSLPQDARLTPILGVLKKYSDDQITVDAAVSSLRGQEADALQQMVAQSPANPDVVEVLAGAATKSRDNGAVQRVLAMASDRKQPEPVRLALLKGASYGLEGGNPNRPSQVVAGGRAGAGIASTGARRRSSSPTGFDLTAEPAALITMASGSGPDATAAKSLVSHLNWPGKPVALNAAAARTPDEEKLYAQGQQIYNSTCAGCHQAEGQGAPHLGAALAGSKYVNGNPEISVRILTNGKDGSIGEMPPLGTTMSDEQLAAVLTYIRASWGNIAAPIHPAEANEYREMNAFHKKPWTNQELDAMPQRAAATSAPSVH